MKPGSPHNPVPACGRLTLEPMAGSEMQVTEMDDRERPADAWVELDTNSTHTGHCDIPPGSRDLR
jgi:hypothetical protein